VHTVRGFDYSVGRAADILKTAEEWTALGVAPVTRGRWRITGPCVLLLFPAAQRAAAFLILYQFSR